MVLDNVLKDVWYAGEVLDAEQFIDQMKSPGNTVVFFLYEGKPAGFAWLNASQDIHAFTHFCMLKNVWGKASVEIAHRLLAWWFAMEKDGTPLLEVILGRTPKHNKRAVKFLDKVGMKVVGEIPLLSLNYYDQGARSPAVISYITRDLLYGQKEGKTEQQ